MVPTGTSRVTSAPFRPVFRPPAPSAPGAVSGGVLGAALPDQDRARVDDLSAVHLHAEHLRVRVAAVARRAAAFLVCHYPVSFLERRRVTFLGASAGVSSTSATASGWTVSALAFGVAFFLGSALPRPLFGFAVCLTSSSYSVAGPTPPTAMIWSAVRCARPPWWTLTRFFDL